MSGSILFSLSDLRPVVLVVLPHSFRIQHRSSDTQVGGASEKVSSGGFPSQQHPHPIMQICH